MAGQEDRDSHAPGTDTRRDSAADDWDMELDAALDASDDAGPGPVDPAGPAGPGPAADPTSGTSSDQDATDPAEALSAARVAAPALSGGRPPGRRRKPRKQRPHPYAHEASTVAEAQADAGLVTAFWLIGSVLMVIAGFWLQVQYGYTNNVAPQDPRWELWNGIPLFTGIALLGLSLLDTKHRNRIAIAGWILFGAYWAMTARDLFTREGSDYVNMIGAMVAVFGINYLAYHEWLNIKRGVQNTATRYLAVVASVAAGFYFLIAKVAPFRVGLIHIVGDHTRGMLDLFGMGDKLGLEFVVNERDTLGPVSFRYPDTHRRCPDGEFPLPRDPGEAACLEQSAAENWFEEILMWIPAGERVEAVGVHGLEIVWVSIILACTAIQTIALFAGLFLGTDAPWRKRLVWVGAVGAVIYILNLMRNTLVIWAYGRGHMSFFMVHNVLAKVLTLAALIGIAMVAFKRFPAFFTALGNVLDLPHRDGPIERTLKLGRRRPAKRDVHPPGPPTF